MAKKSFGLVMLVVVLAFGLSLTSCAHYVTRNGIVTPVGAFTSASIIEGRPVIASYQIIFGLFTVGYDDFLRATEGQDIDIIDNNIIGIIRTIRAVQRSGAE